MSDKKQQPKRSFWDRLWEPDSDRHAGPVNLDALAAQESLGLPGFLHAIPGPAGEVGKYQITPSMFKDLQQFVPGYKNKPFWLTSVVDPWAEKAASDYLNLVRERYAPHYGYAPSEENLVRAYNGGPRGPLRSMTSTYGESYFGWLKKVEK